MSRLEDFAYAASLAVAFDATSTSVYKDGSISVHTERELDPAALARFGLRIAGHTAMSGEGRNVIVYGPVRRPAEVSL